MPETYEARIVIRMDRDDYHYLQSGYERLHFTPSQIVRLAVDRFLIEPEYRWHHPFALARPVYSPDLEDLPETGAALDPASLSVRVDPERRELLKTLLKPPHYSLGAFCRGAIVAPGQVLGSEYIHERMLDLCAERDYYFWRPPPAQMIDLDLNTQGARNLRSEAKRQR
ncbi:MAG TPA: hypothetical protein GX700_15915 [Paracoccus sp.]|nr:hypothetical protein [Paracoccus sp. (in: a-proteobacteria)]